MNLSRIGYWLLSISKAAHELPKYASIFDFVSSCFWFCSVNLQLLRQRYYYATWKADGTRYMMFITREGCYLIDRKFHFRRVQMRFPVKVCIHNHL